MSGIYIPNMQMPTNCAECMVSIEAKCGTDYKWLLNHTDYYDAVRPDCPLVPVPDHGRLIDADALCELCNNSKLKSVDANDIMRMPTIIPADGGD